MAAGSHFGCPKSLCIAFLTISDQYTTILIFVTNFYKMAAGGHFGCPKNHFRSHFWQFQINTKLFFIFYKVATGAHFGCPKITFDLISIHFTSIRNFFFLKFLTKWLTSAILDVRISLSIAFLGISDRCAILICFEIFGKMADVGHFGCPKFTFDRISGHFRSICNFLFFWKFVTKWLPVAILHFWPFQIDRPFWISEIHFLSKFWPFQIDTDFFSGGHFGCLKITLDRISGHFRLIGHFWCPKNRYATLF